MNKAVRVICPFFRVAIGILLVVSGVEKLLSPYQNFLYIIENYEFLTAPLEEMAARVVPWVELFLGLFLVFGLWTKQACAASAVLFLMFIAIVAQALIRGLPINECGCFGELVSFPPQAVILMDSAIFLVLGFLLWKLPFTLTLSCDRYFDQSSNP